MTVGTTCMMPGGVRTSAPVRNFPTTTQVVMRPMPVMGVTVASICQRTRLPGFTVTLIGILLSLFIKDIYGATATTATTNAISTTTSSIIGSLRTCVNTPTRHAASTVQGQIGQIECACCRYPDPHRHTGRCGSGRRKSADAWYHFCGDSQHI